MYCKGDMLVFGAVVFLGVLTVSGANNDFTKISSANNAFATSIYQVLKKDNENLVCSPLSISIVLSMLLDGSPDSSATFKEIQSALQYKGLTKSDVENGYKSLFSSLVSSKDYTLDLADSLWIANNFNVQDTYVAKMQDIFKADVKNFSASNGADIINKWVADHTMNKITQLLDNLDPNTVMVLVNAIYFQASWAKAFPKNNDEDGDFTSNDDSNSKRKVTFMQQEGSFPYFDSTALNAQVLKLDYVGNDVSFVVVLPKNGNSLVQLEKGLSSTDLETAISSAEGQYLNVKLPRFTITSDIPLNDALQQLGIKEAFLNQADFSDIANAIKVSTVVQKAIIEVTENGTVAAAATAAVITTTAVLNGIEFNADHPFLFALYHNPTSSIIFLGRYTAPDM